jgi:hypothetical protein
MNVNEFNNLGIKFRVKCLKIKIKNAPICCKWSR